MSDSRRQSPYDNSFNNYYVIQWSSPVVETGAGELLICEALCCYEVLGLAGVEIIPLSLRLQAQLY